MLHTSSYHSFAYHGTTYCLRNPQTHQEAAITNKQHWTFGFRLPKHEKAQHYSGNMNDCFSLDSSWETQDQCQWFLPMLHAFLAVTSTAMNSQGPRKAKQTELKLQHHWYKCHKKSMHDLLNNHHNFEPTIYKQYSNEKMNHWSSNFSSRWANF